MIYDCESCLNFRAATSGRPNIPTTNRVTRVHISLLFLPSMRWCASCYFNTCSMSLSFKHTSIAYALLLPLTYIWGMERSGLDRRVEWGFMPPNKNKKKYHFSTISFNLTLIKKNGPLICTRTEFLNSFVQLWLKATYQVFPRLST